MKPFPFVLGTDILHVSRLDPIKRSAYFVGIARRVLHPQETSYWRVRPLGSPTGPNKYSNRTLYEWLTIRLSPTDEIEIEENTTKELQKEATRAATWLAGRWAAKEAARKAWGASIISWKDVRVELDDTFRSGAGSKPVKIVCQPHVEKGDDFGESEHQLGLRQEGRLSISHDGEYCVATVIAEPLDEELLSVFRNRALIVQDRKKNEWKKVKLVQDNTTKLENIDQKALKDEEK